MGTGKKAFTLVELVIVIAIFAVTLVLLTPLVNKMRERASIIKCSNSVRLISLALHMYAADHNETFPQELVELYPNYIKEEKIFDCPASQAAGASEKSDYTYIAGLTESSPGSAIILYDRDGNHGKLGRNIVRVSGSVEWVQSTEGKPR